MGSARTLTVLRYIAANVRRLRISRGWTQTQLAHSARLDPRHVQRVERAVVNLTVGALASLADALRTPPGRLFDVADLPPVKQGRPQLERKPARRTAASKR